MGNMNSCESRTAVSLDRLTHKRFLPGDAVVTEYGEGVIAGIDLPLSRSCRWVVQITVPSKPHYLIDRAYPLCFFDREVMIQEQI